MAPVLGDRVYWDELRAALVANVYIGDSSPLLKMNFGILKQWPTWFIWGFNPAAVTLASAVLCSAIQAVCDYCSEAWVGVHLSLIHI